MKMGDQDLAMAGRKVVGHIQRLAQKQDLMGKSAAQLGLAEGV